MNPPTPDPDYPPRPLESIGRQAEPPPYNGVSPTNGRLGETPIPPRRPGPGPRFRGRPTDPTFPAWRYALIGLFTAAAFLLGVFVYRAGWLPGASGREPAGVSHIFAPFWEAWDLVHEDYVDQKNVDDVHMTQFAIAGMLDSLSDEGHTTYLTPKDKQREEEALQGRMEGIGARITVRAHLPTILMTMPDSPARKAGLKAGDVLLAVDDKSISQQPLQQVVEQVRGKAGTSVELTIHRDDQTEPIKISITLGKVEVPDVTWHRIPGEPYLHIGLESFGENADKQLQAALQSARDQGDKGVILDLRGNPGGYKDQAVKVTSEFLKTGDVFLEVDAHGNRSPVPVEPGGTASDIPLVVLIDGGTASAAEICAGALQDHKRAQLVGQKTFGTGTVLQPFDLSDHSEVLLATLKWLTPDGHEIWHQGIKPDVEVALKDPSASLLPEMEDDLSPAAFQKSGDEQLLKAIEVLRGQGDKAQTPGK